MLAAQPRLVSVTMRELKALDLDLAKHVVGVLPGLLDARLDSLDGVGVMLGRGSADCAQLVRQDSKSSERNR